MPTTITLVSARASSAEQPHAVRAGRPRNPGIDEAVLEVAQRHLAEVGYEAMSVATVAAEAGTTRQALYRRWPSKADLATAAIAALAAGRDRAGSDDAFADLVAELRDFRRGVSRPNGLAMVGTMLQGAVDPELLGLYRDRIVVPRRARLRTILGRAVAEGRLPAVSTADLELAVSSLTGAWYGYALAGTRPPRDWPERAARLVWTALGGPADRAASASRT